MKTQAKTIALSIKDTNTYLWAAAFVAANVILPQVCHAFGMSGQVFIPIMFFTLFATIRFGLVCGLLTAVFSPVVSHLIGGMPTLAMLPVIVLKSAALATVMGLVIQKTGRINFVGIVAAVVAYQVAGFVLQGILSSDFVAAWSAVAVSWPGMAIQVAAGTLIAYLVYRRA